MAQISTMQAEEGKLRSGHWKKSRDSPSDAGTWQKNEEQSVSGG